MPDISTCWSCKGPLTSGVLFCSTCGALSAQVGADPFALFGLDGGFDVDVQTLEKTYFGLSRQLHPDKFSAKSGQEQLLALQHTASLNDAYAMLKDDLSRAVYMLRQRGVTVFDEAGQGTTPPALMATSFELHEALDEAETLQALQSLSDHVTKSCNDCLHRLQNAFAAGDIPAATDAALELKFLSSFKREWARKHKQLKDAE